MEYSRGMGNWSYVQYVCQIGDENGESRKRKEGSLLDELEGEQDWLQRVRIYLQERIPIDTGTNYSQFDHQSKTPPSISPPA